MPSFQLHLATIAGMPDAEAAVGLIADYAATQKPTDGDYVVLDVSGGKRAVQMSLAYCTSKKIAVVRPSAGGKSKAKSAELGMDVEWVNIAIPFDVLIRPSDGRLKTYGPGAKSIERATEFLAGAMAFPALVSPIEIDVSAALDALNGQVERLQLRGVEVADYSHDSYMIGKYAPKFLDSRHGMDFMTEYVEGVNSISIRFAGPSGQVNLKLTGKAGFSYTAHEDDRQYVDGVLTKLAGWK